MLPRLTVAALRCCARIDHQSKQMHSDRNVKKCDWSEGAYFHVTPVPGCDLLKGRWVWPGLAADRGRVELHSRTGSTSPPLMLPSLRFSLGIGLL